MQINTRKNIFSVAALLALIGAAAPMAASAQSADFTWYGRIDMGLESNSDGSVSRVAIQNFASRLGIRGERKFVGDLSGMFQVETGIAPDETAQSKTFASRNSFVGLKSPAAGSLIVGTHDMPLKTLEGTSGGLWGEGDLVEILVHGKAARSSVGSSKFNNVHTRQTNVLLYTSPKFADVTAKLAYSPDEAKSDATATSPAFNKSTFGASIEYNDGTFNAGIATQQQKQFNGAAAIAAVAATPTKLAVDAVAAVPGSTMKGTKLTLGAKMNAWAAGVAFSRLDNSAGLKTSNFVVSGSYALDSATTLKASFGKAGESASNANDGTTGLAIEADYALDKQFTVYGYYASLRNDASAKATFAGADNFPATAAAGKDPRALGVGIRYNF